MGMEMGMARSCVRGIKARREKFEVIVENSDGSKVSSGSLRPF